MKYHNPKVKFSFEAVDKEESDISFKLSEIVHCIGQHALLLACLTGSGETRNIVTTGLRQNDIRTEIETFIDNMQDA